MNGFEIKILDFIRNNLTNPVFDYFFKYITKLGDGGVFYIILAVVLIVFKKTRKTGLTMAVALLLGYLTGNLIIKNIVARARPYEINTAIKLIVSKPWEYSFPSGHALASTECALSVFFYNKKWGTVALITAALIIYSRLYLYVHYPSDVIAGALLGVCTAFASRQIIKKLYIKYSKE